MMSLGRCGARLKKKTLLVNGTRISPKTSPKNALSQLVREHIASLKIARLRKDVDFSIIRVVNVANHESRHSGFVSTNAFIEMKDIISQYEDEYDEIIILFTDAIRIGAKEEHVTELLSELSEISPDKISVLCLSDAGRDLKRVARSYEKYLQTWINISNSIGSHVNGGSQLTRHPDLEELANEIQRKKTEIIKESEAIGKLDKAIMDAAGRGKRIEAIPKELEKTYGKCVKSIEEDGRDENVEKVARRWIHEVELYQTYRVGGNVGGGDSVNCIMYLRTTPTEHELNEEFDDESGGRVYVDGIPRAQASGNLAAMLCLAEDRGEDFSAVALLNDKRKKRGTIKRPGIMKLMTALCSGPRNFKFVFMETMNRAGSKRAQNLLLIKVCQIVGAEIILAKNVGQAIELPGDGAEPSWHVTANDVVKTDVERMEALEEALKTCKEEIGAVSVTFSDCNLLKNMSDADKAELSKKWTKCAAMSFTKKQYKIVAEEIKEWYRKNENEDNIFGELSDEEEEDDGDDSCGESSEEESSEEEEEDDDEEEDEL